MTYDYTHEWKGIEKYMYGIVCRIDHIPLFISQVITEKIVSPEG